MQRFSKIGHRVKVIREANGIALNALGTVVRMRISDGGAFIALDKRSKVKKAHPFPADDDRGTHVLAYPEDCEPARGNARERHVADRIDAAEWPVRTLDNLGKDHWSTFGYIQTTLVDSHGVPDRARVRCNVARHPALGDLLRDACVEPKARWPFPTKLKDGTLLPDHDDWDCLDDLCELGLLINIGSSANPQFRPTDLGNAVWMKLREHKLAGGNFADFTPPTKARLLDEEAAIAAATEVV